MLVLVISAVVAFATDAYQKILKERTSFIFTMEPDNYDYIS